MARDAGPNSADERHHDCAAYNGEGGGQHYQWFAPRLFRAILVQLGCFDVERVTEAVCVDALEITSARIASDYRSLKEHLVRYAGPQCFPQLADAARSCANERRDPGRSGVVHVDAVQEAWIQMMRCWLSCHNCRRWRLVDRLGLPALTSERFVESGAQGNGS